MVAVGTAVASADPAPFEPTTNTCGNDRVGAEAIACAKLYTDIYNKDPMGTHADEALFNAGSAYMQAGATGGAITMFNLLKKYFPNSRLTSAGLVRIGKIYGDIAFYDRAADMLEEYAKKYASEKDAPLAMSDAILYRRGLGDYDKAIDDSNYFIRTWGTRLVAESASAYWGIVEIYESRGDRDAALKGARAYIAKFGKSGGDARNVVVYERIGEWMAAKSCPVALTEGLCVKVERARATCGPAVVMTGVARDDHDWNEAMAAFVSARLEYDKWGGKMDDDEASIAARAAVGRAIVVTQAPEIEKTALRPLASALPYEKRTAEYEERSKQGYARLDRALAEADALRDPTAIVAALRVRAQYMEGYASSVERGLCAKTKDVTKEPTVEALHAATAAAYERCAATAVAQNYPDGSMTCIRGIERMTPELFVPFRELVNREPKSGLPIALENLR